jgi:hypothetical protein
MVNPKEATMVLRSLMRVTTAAVVVAVALLLAIPFFLALTTPFVGR